MALFSITGDGIKQITKIPHDNINRPIINRIPRPELDAIIEELDRRVD